MAEYSAALNEDTFEIVSDAMPISQIPAAAVRFVKLLVRTSELAQWRQVRVALRPLNHGLPPRCAVLFAESGVDNR
jgi:hypothetical protein